MILVDPVTLRQRWHVPAPVKQFVLAGGLSVLVNVGSRILLFLGGGPAILIH